MSHPNPDSRREGQAMTAERLAEIDAFIARVSGDPTRNTMLKEVRAELTRLRAENERLCGLAKAVEKISMNSRDWAIRSIVDGAETDRIIQYPTEIEARDWVKRFPKSYSLLSRISAGDWEKIEQDAARAGLEVE